MESRTSRPVDAPNFACSTARRRSPKAIRPVPAPPIPTWKERLAACFRWRYRLLHVFGVPGAVGAATSVAAASFLNPDTGLALGVLVAGVGTLIGGYYVTAGFDRRLVERLQGEKVEADARLDAEHLQAV